MNIEYKNCKNLPCDQLYRLFFAVGWVKENQATQEIKTTQEMMDHFNIGFLNSTFVFSAWDGDTLVGCVRVLSDLHFRSVIYDFAVLPQYQRRGIGTELLKRCRSACRDSEWLVQTDTARIFYEKNGFQINNDDFLTIPCKWFS